MFPRSVLIDRINTATPYTALPARPMDSQQQEPTSLPTIFVGYHGVQRTPAVPVNLDYLNQHGEDIIQVFEIRIYATEATLYTIWRNVYTAINGYSPILSNTSTASVSGFAFVIGETVEVNDKLIDTSKWAIGFPSTNVLL